MFTVNGVKLSIGPAKPYRLVIKLLVLIVLFFVLITSFIANEVLSPKTNWFFYKLLVVLLFLFLLLSTRFTIKKYKNRTLDKPTNNLKQLNNQRPIANTRNINVLTSNARLRRITGHGSAWKRSIIDEGFPWPLWKYVRLNKMDTNKNFRTRNNNVLGHFLWHKRFNLLKENRKKKI